MSIGLGLAALLALVPVRRWAVGGTAFAITLSLLMTLNAWELRPAHGPRTPAPQMAFHALELNYAEVGRWLRSEQGVSDATWVAAGDIGALGFYSRARIFDTIGLVTEGTAPYYEDQAAVRAITAPGANYAIPPDLVLDAAPAYVVVMQDFVRLGLAQDDRFLAQYALIRRIPTDYYGGAMLVYERRQPATARQ
ncbi:MAG: hypothetical protein HC915_16555 [Anaerolineae bacterium]|nr:hypothetical protein [Anaerolineae bacterium]